MQLIKYPGQEDWKALLDRPYIDNRAVLDSVQMILNAVRLHGDEAIKSLTKKFDGLELDTFIVTKNEIEESKNLVPQQLKQAIAQAKKNIETFHRKQLTITEEIETMPGVKCWRKQVAIESVGLYIPGGTAPLFSTVLMLGIPSMIAGCIETSLFTPPSKEGKIHPAILYCADLVGISRIYKIGGAQAIAAMAFGTGSSSPVDKIFGPGNQYVTAAKQLVQMQGVAIDMPAGPSEVCILADETANPAFLAADLLSQAEHGPDSQVILITTSEQLANEVQQEIENQLPYLPRWETALKALGNSKTILLNNLEEAIVFVNSYASEHLIISCAEARMVAEKIRNAGSVFIGNYSPESVGDYASGTNHTLPTNGFARAYSGVSVDSFVKNITYQELSEDGLKNIAETVICLAEEEGLQAHANAVKLRLYNKQD